MEYFAFQWHITEACDQRCKHCYIYALGSHAKFKEMTVADMDKEIGKENETRLDIINEHISKLEIY